MCSVVHVLRRALTHQGDCACHPLSALSLTRIGQASDGGSEGMASKLIQYFWK